MTATDKSILNRIAAGFNRDRDHVDPTALLCDIQMAMGCTYGQALNYANEIRMGKHKSTLQENCETYTAVRESRGRNR